LSKLGLEQSATAGKSLKDSKYIFDVAHTSLLKRAEVTCKTLLSEAMTKSVPIEQTWRLNGANMGGLTGMTSKEATEKYGSDVLYKLKTDFNARPPLMEEENVHYKSICNDEKYSKENISPLNEFPLNESLQDCQERALIYWKDVISPQVQANQKVLIVAHDDVLRCFMKYFHNQSEENIMSLRIPHAIPFECSFDKDMNPTKTVKFLGDAATISNAMIRAHMGFLSAKSEETNNNLASKRKELMSAALKVINTVDLRRTKKGKDVEFSLKTKRHVKKPAKVPMNASKMKTKKAGQN